jgi:hypothetical protein
MRYLWPVIIVAWLVLAVEAHADTVYLKDGQSYWGSEIVEVGDTVVVKRPGGALRFSKNEVLRIERAQISIPRFYAPPGGGESVQPTAGPTHAPERPSPPAATLQQPAPASGPEPTTAGSPASPSSGGPPPGPTPTLLPPPPPRGPYAPK